MTEERWGYYLEGGEDADPEMGVGDASTKLEAIKEALAEFGYDACKGRLRIGKATKAEFPTVSAVENLQDCEDAMIDEYSEEAEGWLSSISDEFITELETRINDVIRQWLDEKDIWPDLYDIEDGDLVSDEELASALKEIGNHETE